MSKDFDFCNAYKWYEGDNAAMLVAIKQHIKTVAKRNHKSPEEIFSLVHGWLEKEFEEINERKRFEESVPKLPPMHVFKEPNG